MAETLDVPQMLSAFWHKTRCRIVPLTASEWVARTGIEPRERATIRGRHLVTVDRKGHDDDPIYQLTLSGFELIQGAGLLPLPPQAEMTTEQFMRSLGFVDQPVRKLK